MSSRILWVVLLVIFPACLYAQMEPAAVSDFFFPDLIPEKSINVPAFTKNDGFTTHEEMMSFLANLQKEHPSLIKIENVGYTQRGLGIPLVTVKSDTRTDKIRLFYCARVHGNEPSGTEAMLYFIRQMAEDPSLRYLLDKLAFYILPLVNGDGAYDDDRLSANRININRDMTRLDTPEAVTLHHVVNQIQPHIAVDYHEYMPYHERYAALSNVKVLIPWDVMFFYSGNPNVSQDLRQIVSGYFLPNASATIEKYGLTHHLYYSSSLDANGISFMLGDNSPTITCTAFGLRNTIALLMETRGIGLRRVSLKRRVYAAYLLALSVAQTAYGNDTLVRETLAKSLTRKDSIVVKHSPKPNKMVFPFIDASTNELRNIDVNVKLAVSAIPEKAQKMPEAYYLLPDQQRAVQVLQEMGVEVSILKKKTKVNATSYIVVSFEQEETSVKNVVFEKRDQKVMFPAGSFCVNTKQRNIRLIGVLLEPESIDGFIHSGIIKIQADKELSIYKVSQK